VQLARKLGCDEKEVRRMLDPRHRTKLPRIKEALDVFGKCLVVSVEEADWPFQLSSPRGARPRRAVSALLPTQASEARLWTLAFFVGQAHSLGSQPAAAS
jgi:hypothetical protein